MIEKLGGKGNLTDKAKDAITQAVGTDGIITEEELIKIMTEAGLDMS
jgi:hypothetical protein